MRVIYEVNIRVAHPIYDEYVHWIKHHVKDMLKLDGFEKALIFSEDSEPSSNTAEQSIVVQYYLNSRQDLDHYFLHHAADMRKQTKDLFGEQFSVTRRILTLMDSIHCTKESIDE